MTTTRRLRPTRLLATVFLPFFRARARLLLTILEIKKKKKRGRIVYSNNGNTIWRYVRVVVGRARKDTPGAVRGMLFFLGGAFARLLGFPLAKTFIFCTRNIRKLR